MWALKAGSCRRQSGQRYVAGLVLDAGRTVYQLALRKSSVPRVVMA